MILLKYNSSHLYLFKNIKFLVAGPSKIIKILLEKVKIPGIDESEACYLIHHTPIKSIYYSNIQKIIEYNKITGQNLDFKPISMY